MKVTKETIIGKLLEEHPSVATVMLEHGLGCVGCPSKASESIEAGCKMHGFDDAAVNELIDEINKSIQEQQNKPDKITLTDSAAEEIKRLLKDEKPGMGLKVSVLPGCSGFNYELGLGPKEDLDVELSDKGVKIFIGKKALQLLKGSEIDYSEEGFRINNQ